MYDEIIPGMIFSVISKELGGFHLIKIKEIYPLTSREWYEQRFFSALRAVPRFNEGMYAEKYFLNCEIKSWGV